ncbi:unnamed protein product [Acanthoscelides obtectus]|uniref:Mos1 transposase HTH domain-containing protein n=1 Tax=Acanthoscelides obtectus TaxID=200917 RepID=A0A9P0PQK0_ACAOB|nr:unnamed protein product [Acanthoscelides obtectus]CAK1648285.1 Histone-lysine N-methyltransferase SETMAR [Acanthoscelides obtectus]
MSLSLPNKRSHQGIAEIFNERVENSNVHRKYVLELVAKFRETGSVANKKRNIENPLRNEAIETMCGVGQCTFQRILKAHSFHPYKIHLVQELKEDDFGFLYVRIVKECLQITPQILQNVRQGKMELNREHFRPIIYYKFQRQLSQQEYLAELLCVFGNEAPHQPTISHWYGEFNHGGVSLSDDPRVGASKTAVTQENVDAVRKLIIEDRHVTYSEIETSLKTSKTSSQKNIHEELGVRKLVSRWIPHLLTEEQKAVKVNWYVYSIVSGDESWIYCYKPEDKRQSAVWVFQGEEKPTKVIRSRSIPKKMVATFVSKTGHIATIPLNEQRIVTADWYTTICLPKNHPERRIILHQDNARSRTAQKTRQYLTEENVELLNHPPYSTDLSPNDFFTFPKIKKGLRGQRFQSPEEAVDAFKNAVLDLPANEWNKCFENWFGRMQMCINLLDFLK